MRIRSVIVPAFALLALTASAQAPEGQGVLPALVTVTGSAESKTAPDMATLRIGVEVQALTAREAQTGANALTNRLIDAALKIVPDRKAYQTSDLSLFPEYSQGFGGIRGGATGVPQGERLVGYRARNVLVVRIEDMDKVGPLVDAATGAGATNIDSIAFGLRDEKPSRKLALRDAVRDAREKAEALAEGLDLRLGDVYSIDEGGGPIVRPYEMAGMAVMKDARTPVMPGQVSLSANVTVRFRLVK